MCTDLQKCLRFRGNLFFQRLIKFTVGKTPSLMADSICLKNLQEKGCPS